MSLHVNGEGNKLFILGPNYVTASGKFFYKATVRYLSEWLLSKRREIKCVGENVEKGNLHTFLVGM